VLILEVVLVSEPTVPVVIELNVLVNVVEESVGIVADVIVAVVEIRSVKFPEPTNTSEADREPEKSPVFTIIELPTWMSVSK
jgi:hypothetical protein